ncbi:MAG: TIGR02117 family protein [Gammaproteobacteria bacterium]|nr:TIGR02117 family protein [Gammaproteobacteria bacterium]
MPALQNQFGDVGSLEFGWGDKGFYQAEEITLGLTVRAMLWPTESVMHVVAVPQSPREYFPDSEVVTFCLTDSALSSLIQFIASSFKRNDIGDVMPLQSGIYGDSQFYQGEGDYYLMNTCNKWTAKGLRSAGMNISLSFKLTADSVMDHLKKEMSPLLLAAGRMACR